MKHYDAITLFPEMFDAIADCGVTRRALDEMVWSLKCWNPRDFATTPAASRWLRLGQACGLTREALLSHRHLLPGVRFAVDAYVHFAREAPWQEAIASSLTELFAPTIHQQRLDGWPDKYPWIEDEGLGYFRMRLSQARRDVEHGLEFTLAHFDTRPKQQRVLEILQFKLDVLWSMADAMWRAYVDGMPPYHGCEA